MKSKVRVVGPFYTDEQAALLQRIVEVARERGFSVTASKGDPIVGVTESPRDACLKVLDAEILIAVLGQIEVFVSPGDSRLNHVALVDSNVAFEMGVAVGADRRVIGYSTDAPGQHELEDVCSTVCMNLDELKRWL